MKYLSVSLILIFFFSGNLLANTCTPEVKGKKVLVELINGNGKTIYSEQHRVRTKGKYAGLISSSKALEALEKDRSKNIKIGKTKLKLLTGGHVTKIKKTDGTALAKIGGCPVSKIKLYTRIGEQKKPFIHKDVLKLAAKSTAKAIAENKTAGAIKKQSDKSNGSPQMPSEYKGHQGPITNIAYSLDGSFIASSSGLEATVNLWRAYDGRLIKSFNISPRQAGFGFALGAQNGFHLAAVAISPNNRYLAYGNSGKLNIWDIKKGKMFKEITAGVGLIYDIAYSPDGKFLAFTNARNYFPDIGKNIVVLLDAKSTKELGILKSEQQPATDIEFNRTGTRLVVGSAFYIANSARGKIFLSVWDCQSKRMVKEYRTQHPVISVAISPDSTLLAAVVGVGTSEYRPRRPNSDANELKVWNIRTGGTLNGFKYSDDSEPFRDTFHWGKGVAFSDDGELLASGVEGGKLVIWGVKEKKIIHTINPAHYGYTTTVKFGLNNDHLISGGSDNGLNVWRIKKDSFDKLKLLLEEAPRDFMKLVQVSEFFSSKDLGYVSQQDKEKGEQLIRDYFDKIILESTKLFVGNQSTVEDMVKNLGTLNGEKYRSLLAYVLPDKREEVKRLFSERRTALVGEFLKNEEAGFQNGYLASSDKLAKLQSEVVLDNVLRVKYKAIEDDPLLSEYKKQHTQSRHALIREAQGAIADKFNKAESVKEMDEIYFLYVSSSDNELEPDPVVAVLADYKERLYHFKPFLDFEGSKYLNAIYSGNYESVRFLDKQNILALVGKFSGILGSATSAAYVKYEDQSLIVGVMAVYLFNYKKEFSQCLRADAVPFTVDRTTETTTRDGLGSFISKTYGPTDSTDYMVNREFDPIFRQIFRWKEHPLKLGKISEPLTGAKEIMGNFECDDPKIKTFETNLKRLYEQHYRL